MQYVNRKNFAKSQVKTNMIILLQVVPTPDGLSEQVNALWRLQAESQVELNALLPSVLDRTFKGEL